jgi:hypothetical protein
MKLKIAIYTFCLSFSIASCKKYLQIPPSPDLIISASLFDNISTATSAVDGVYALMRISIPTLANGSLSLYTGLSSDELYTSSTDIDITAFYKNSLPSTSNTVNDNFWSISYEVIYRCNAILSGLQASTGITDSAKKQLSGEMHTVRALYYFYLVNIFGDVPLVTGTTYQTNSSLPRSPAANVYIQIIGDLTTAETELTSTYPSDSKARPNRWAAASLLARAYLYTKDYANADKQATLVIDSAGYSLETDLNNVFLISNNETIWQIATPNETTPTGDAASFVPYDPTIIPSYVITQGLFNDFDSNDQREVNWLASSTVDTSVYYYPYKYKNNNYGTPTEYEIVLRLAEVFLIRAEARYYENRFSDVPGDINQLRSRANVALINSTDPSVLLPAIAHENRIEFFCEWGHRWLDLKRTNTIDAVLAYKPNWTTSASLYPIPFQEIQFNPALKQNPGY